MVNGFLKLEMLEQLLQRHWIDFVDNVRLMHKVMTDVRDTSFKEITQDENHPRQVNISITHIEVKAVVESTIPEPVLELWVEYTIPRDKGMVIGTGIYFLNLKSGDLSLRDLFGTYFTQRQES